MGTQLKKDSVPGSLIVVGGQCASWTRVLEQTGWVCHMCYDLRQANHLLQELGPCIAIVDLSHDDFSLQAISQLVTEHKRVRWVAFIRDIQTESQQVCQFIAHHCVDFFTHPIPDMLLLNTVDHQLGMLQLNKPVYPTISSSDQFGILGESQSVKRLREHIRRIAPTDVSVLLCGENGSGKSHCANTLHHYSCRSKHTYLTINCSSYLNCINESVAHSELTSHCEWDIQSCLSHKLAQANHGTVLLKDIELLPQAQQLQLLHVIRDGQVELEGQWHDCDIRVFAISCQELGYLREQQLVHPELLARISAININVPPLRERLSDIPLLASHYIERFSHQYNTQARSIHPNAINRLIEYHWPGNLREFINQIKRLVLLTTCLEVNVEHVELPEQYSLKKSLKAIREDSEKAALLTTLETHEGHVSLAAKVLKISRATMYRLLAKHSLDIST